MRMQASLLASAAQTVEVAALKQDLEGSKKELGLAKRQLEEKKGKTPVPVTSVHPEATDNLLEALCGASIDQEHRTIMTAVVKKVQSAKSGLNEACALR